MLKSLKIVCALAAIGPIYAFAAPADGGFEMQRVQDAQTYRAPLSYDLEGSAYQVRSASASTAGQAGAPANAASSSSASDPAHAQTAMAGVMGAAAASAAISASSMSKGTAVQAASDSSEQTMPAAYNGEVPSPAELELSSEVDLSLGIDEGITQAYAKVLSKKTLGAALQVTPEDAAAALKDLRMQDGVMTAVFDEKAASDFLASAGAAVFNGLDNPILVWMVNHNAEDSNLVSGDNVTEFASALMNDAQELKYRLMLPLMDIDDIQKVSVNTVIMRNASEIAQASARYGCDYFLTMAVENRQGLGSVKWSLYDKSAKLLTGSEVSGITEELASLTAGDIARTLAGLSGQSSEPAQALASARDVFELGPGDGFVRVKIENAVSLKDLAAIKLALITYGYDSGCNVQGIDGQALIIEIPTSSDPQILDGTMARARDFTKLGPWHYALIKSVPQRSSYQGLGVKSASRPDSRIPAVPHSLLEQNEAGKAAGSGITGV